MNFSFKSISIKGLTLTRIQSLNALHWFQSVELKIKTNVNNSIIIIIIYFSFEPQALTFSKCLKQDRRNHFTPLLSESVKGTKLTNWLKLLHEKPHQNDENPQEMQSKAMNQCDSRFDSMREKLLQLYQPWSKELTA